MRQNPSNAVIALGTAKGTVEYWTPGIGTPAMNLFVGAGIQDIGFYKNYMITASESVKIWDMRMIKQVDRYSIPRKLTSLEVSQTGLLAFNYGYKVEMYKDAHQERQKEPYLRYSPSSHANNVKFVPFMDLMGLGLDKGFSSIAVPGAGSVYYNSMNVNPF